MLMTIVVYHQAHTGLHPHTYNTLQSGVDHTSTVATVQLNTQHVEIPLLIVWVLTNKNKNKIKIKCLGVVVIQQRIVVFLQQAASHVSFFLWLAVQAPLSLYLLYSVINMLLYSLQCNVCITSLSIVYTRTRSCYTFITRTCSYYMLYYIYCYYYILYYIFCQYYSLLLLFYYCYSYCYYYKSYCYYYSLYYYVFLLIHNFLPLIQLKV